MEKQASNEEQICIKHATNALNSEDDEEFVMSENYVVINKEERVCPSCKKIRNGLISEKNAEIPKLNAGRMAKGRASLSMIPLIQGDIVSTIGISKLEGGWTRYECEWCGSVSMEKKIAKRVRP